MIKQKLLDTDDETKYRWIQNYNPMTATYEQVVADNITKVTTAGYSSHDLYGGLRYNAKAWDIGYYHNVNGDDWLIGLHYKF